MYMNNHFVIHNLLLENYIIKLLTIIRFCSLGKGQFKNMSTDHQGSRIYLATGSELSKSQGLQLQIWICSIHILGYLLHICQRWSMLHWKGGGEISKSMISFRKNKQYKYTYTNTLNPQVKSPLHCQLLSFQRHFVGLRTPPIFLS